MKYCKVCHAIDSKTACHPTVSSVILLSDVSSCCQSCHPAVCCATLLSMVSPCYQLCNPAVSCVSMLSAVSPSCQVYMLALPDCHWVSVTGGRETSDSLFLPPTRHMTQTRRSSSLRTGRSIQGCHPQT